jgi:hypothetical protein
MSQGSSSRRGVPAAARVFGDLQASEALSPGGVSALRKTSAIFLALLVLGATPLFFAAYAAGVIGDAPTAIAKSNSGPGGGDDDSSGPGSGGDDDDDDDVTVGTDATSADGASTAGTTNDNDTVTKLGTDDTSADGHSTRGTTNDNDTRTKMGTDDTSANAHSTAGTTNDNDTDTVDSGQTRTGHDA